MIGNGTKMKIFISYRRADTADQAGRIVDTLISRFGPESIFMDVSSILPGADFAESTIEALSSCDAVLAVIGKNWQAYDREVDFVYLEIAEAIRRGILVIPVLIGDVKMPDASELPDQVQPLVRKNAVRLHSSTFRRDLEPLLDLLTRGVREKGGTRSAPAAELTRLVTGSGLRVPSFTLTIRLSVEHHVVEFDPPPAWRSGRLIRIDGHDVFKGSLKEIGRQVFMLGDGQGKTCVLCLRGGFWAAFRDHFANDYVNNVIIMIDEVEILRFNMS